MEATISKIRKNSSAETWVSLREYQGRQYVDLREHFFSTDDQQWHPNKKGIMLLPELVAKVIEGLEELQEATEIGTVAVIPKSAREEIQIGYREYERSRYGEVRAWYCSQNSATHLFFPNRSWRSRFRSWDVGLHTSQHVVSMSAPDVALEKMPNPKFSDRSPFEVYQDWCKSKPI